MENCKSIDNFQVSVKPFFGCIKNEKPLGTVDSSVGLKNAFKFPFVDLASKSSHHKSFFRGVPLLRPAGHASLPFLEISQMKMLIIIKHFFNIVCESLTVETWLMVTNTNSKK